MSPKFWVKACRDLSSRDEVMAKLITSYRGERLRSRGEAFETLLRSIVGQQISVKAAQSVWEKLCLQVNPADPTTIVACKTERLRKAGLSGRKVEYACDLARHFLDGSVAPERWREMDDEEVIAELTVVRGIGRWTAEMFLIFHLLRPNVFPVADLGLQKALALAYGKRYPVSDRQLQIFRRRFDPWNSVAVWYLWRSLDPIPVEY
ncbi:MAG: DNA-3-methyladenine glycosylase [Bdellovibrionales bacterium]